MPIACAICHLPMDFTSYLDKFVSYGRRLGSDSIKTVCVNTVYLKYIYGSIQTLLNIHIYKYDMFDCQIDTKRFMFVMIIIYDNDNQL